VKALTVSVCEVIMALFTETLTTIMCLHLPIMFCILFHMNAKGETETRSIKMCLHLPGIWCILFHMTAKRVDWEREDTYMM